MSGLGAKAAQIRNSCQKPRQDRTYQRMTQRVGPGAQSPCRDFGKPQRAQYRSSLGIVLWCDDLWVLGRPHFAIEAGRRFGVKTLSSPTCSLFTVPRRWAA